MGRPFEFKFAITQEARLRQDGQCACCGESLDDTLEHAHHVVPNQSGKPGNRDHLWLKRADNCVVLCETCHYRVHQDGRYRNGAVAPPEYYRYSHGEQDAAHDAWVDKLHKLMRTVW